MNVSERVSTNQLEITLCIDRIADYVEIYLMKKKNLLTAIFKKSFTAQLGKLNRKLCFRDLPFLLALWNESVFFKITDQKIVSFLLLQGLLKYWPPTHKRGQYCFLILTEYGNIRVLARKPISCRWFFNVFRESRKWLVTWDGLNPYI